MTSQFPKYEYLEKYFFNTLSDFCCTRRLQVLKNEGLIPAATNSAIGIVENRDPNWLNFAIEEMKKADDAGVSATLAEIRAYGELCTAFPVMGKQTRGKGSDFNLAVDGGAIEIEVHAPQGASIKKNPIAKQFTQGTRADLFFELTEVFPFGVPSRAADNIQCEATSSIASIKKEEHQLSSSQTSILWVDFLDPEIWPFSLEDQTVPLATFGNRITSGAIWHAFYGRRGMPIFDGLEISGLPSKIYHMEFDGRFQKKSKIDFAIFSFENAQVVFENPGTVRTSKELFRGIHSLHKFNLERSWIEWPSTGALSTRISEMGKKIASYESAFK